MWLSSNVQVAETKKRHLWVRQVLSKFKNTEICGLTVTMRTESTQGRELLGLFAQHVEGFS